jgi:hypothetical protein
MKKHYFIFILIVLCSRNLSGQIEQQGVVVYEYATNLEKFSKSSFGKALKNPQNFDTIYELQKVVFKNNLSKRARIDLYQPEAKSPYYWDEFEDFTTVNIKMGNEIKKIFDSESQIHYMHRSLRINDCSAKFIEEKKLNTLNCKIYQCISDNDTTNYWITNDLPESAGIEQVKFTKGCVIQKESKDVSVKLIELIPNTINDSLFFLPEFTRTVESYPIPTGEKKDILQGIQFPDFTFFDFKGKQWTQADLSKKPFCFIIMPIISEKTTISKISEMVNAIPTEKISTFAICKYNQFDAVKACSSFNDKANVSIIPNAQEWVNQKLGTYLSPIIILIDKNKTVKLVFPSDEIVEKLVKSGKTPTPTEGTNFVLAEIKKLIK